MTSGGFSDETIGTKPFLPGAGGLCNDGNNSCRRALQSIIIMVSGGSVSDVMCSSPTLCRSGNNLAHARWSSVSDLCNPLVADCMMLIYLVTYRADWKIAVALV